VRSADGAGAAIDDQQWNAVGGLNRQRGVGLGSGRYSDVRLRQVG
jgi:hypothetical protein